MLENQEMWDPKTHALLQYLETTIMMFSFCNLKIADILNKA